MPESRRSVVNAVGIQNRDPPASIRLRNASQASPPAFLRIFLEFQNVHCAKRATGAPEARDAAARSEYPRCRLNLPAIQQFSILLQRHRGSELNRTRIPAREAARATPREKNPAGT